MQIRKIYRAVVASLAWATLVAEYYVEATNGAHTSIAATTLHYISFLTILTNFLVALVLTASLLAPENRLRIVFGSPAPRAAIALYVVVVAVVHHLLLADLNQHLGLSAVTNAMMHTVLPILYVVDWIAFAPKRPITYRGIPFWLIFPASYGLFAVTKGVATGIYPYPFLNIEEHGVSGVALNIVGFAVVYAAGAAVFITLGKFTAKSH